MFMFFKDSEYFSFPGSISDYLQQSGSLELLEHIAAKKLLLYLSVLI